MNLLNVFLWYGVPQEMCAAVCCLEEERGVVLSVVLPSCLALLERLVCTVLFLSVGGFPLVLSRLTQSRSSAVLGLERTPCPADPAKEGSLARLVP